MSVTLDVDDEEIPGLDAAGRPDPAYAERLGLVPAPAGRRSAAFALDAFIWIVLAAPAAVGAALLVDAVLRSGGEVAVIASGGLQQPLVLIAVGQGLVTIFGIVQLALHGRKAITVGKAAFGLRSVNVARFDNPGFWRIVWRSFVLWGAQSVVPLIGPAVLFASSAWDPEHRGRSWLDRVGGCYVIDVRHGLDPLNPKALRHARRALVAPPATDTPPLPSLATDRGPDDHTFIPAARSSSGVISPAVVGDWTPPPVGGQTAGTDSTTAAGTPSAPPTHPPSGGISSGRPWSESAVLDEPVWLLVFDDGTRLEAPRRARIGRAPAPASTGESALLVPIVDESMGISKTHAEFGVDASGLWIIDHASRNGTTMRLPDGAIRDLPAGNKERVPAGSRVTLGGRSFTVSVESRGRR